MQPRCSKFSISVVCRKLGILLIYPKRGLFPVCIKLDIVSDRRKLGVSLICYKNFKSYLLRHHGRDISYSFVTYLAAYLTHWLKTRYHSISLVCRKLDKRCNFPVCHKLGVLLVCHKSLISYLLGHHDRDISYSSVTYLVACVTRLQEFEGNGTTMKNYMDRC